MDETLKEVLTDLAVIAVNVAYVFLPGIMAAAALLLRKELAKRGIELKSEEMRLAYEIVATNVMHIQQTRGGASGVMKFAQAMRDADEMLKARGIKVTTYDLKTLVERAVFEYLPSDGKCERSDCEMNEDGQCAACGKGVVRTLESEQR